MRSGLKNLSGAGNTDRHTVKGKNQTELVKLKVGRKLQVANAFLERQVTRNASQVRAGNP